MAQESRLAITIDSSRAQPSAEDLAKALDALDAAGVRVTSSSERAGRSAADAGRAYNKAGKEADAGAAGVNRVNRSLDQTETSAAAAAASIRRNLIAAIGGLSAMKLVDVADNWGQMASRIKMATQSSEEYERVQARMVSSANATFRNITETREAFVQLSPVLRQMGMSLDQSMDAIDAFSGLMVTNAASTERGAAAMRALSVSLQKGKMDADQWITIYSSLDSIVETIAAHSGMAAEEIRRLGASGDLSVRLIAQALAGQLAPIMAQVEEMPTTVRDSMQRVGNEFTNYIGKANEVNGVTAAMADGIAFFGENLTGVLNVGLVAGAGALALYTSRTIGSTAATVADALAKRAAAMQELELARASTVTAAATLAEASAQVTSTAATLAQVRAVQTLAASKTQLIAATAAYDAAIKAQTAAELASQAAMQRSTAAKAAAGGAGRSLVGVLGGPVGLLATVGLTAAAFITMDGASDRVKLSMDKLTGSAEDASKSFAKLGTISRQTALDTLTALQADQIRAAGKAMADFVDELEPNAARGTRAVAKMRANMRSEMTLLIGDVSTAGGDLEQAIDGLINKWVEEGIVNQSAVAELRKSAAAMAQARDAANETSARIGELSEQSAKLDAAARAAAGGVSTLNNALAGTDEAGKKYLERLSDQSVTAGLKTQRQQLDALVAAGKLIYSSEDLAKAQAFADKIDKATSSLKAGSQAAKEHASAMKALLDTHLPQNKALEELNKNLALIEHAHKAGKVSAADYAKALVSINTAYKKQIDDLLPESVKKAREQLKAAQEQIKAVTQQVRVFGLAESAVTRLAVADTDSAIAKLQAERATIQQNEMTVERIAHIDKEIEALGRLRDVQVGISGQQQQLEFLEAEKKAWETWSSDVEKIFQQVGQSLTDAIFDGGKSGRELVKDLFKTLTLRVFIEPAMKGLQGFVTNEIGALMGHQNPAQQQSGIGGMVQNANSLNSIFGAGYQALTGASAGASTASLGYANAVGMMGGDSIGALITANGGWEGAMAGFGSSGSGAAAAMETPGISAGIAGGAAGTAAGIAALGTGLGASLGTTIGTSAAAMATTTFSASLGAGAVAGGAAGVGGAAMGGLGAAMGAIGAAMPYIGAAIMIAQAIGVFDEGPPKTRHGQRTTAELADGSFGITQRDDRVGAGGAEVVQQMADASIKAANEIFTKVGVDAAIDSFYAIMESSVLGDRNGVASGGTLRSGDGTSSNIGINKTSDMTLIGFGGWSEEEMFPRLATDIQLSILEAFALKADELPSVMADMLTGVDIRGLGTDETAALIARFYGVVTEVESFRTALEALPFETLKALSFDAAAGLIAAAGGLENLTTGLGTYYQNFYTQEEQLDFAAKQMSSALASIGAELPDMTQGAAAAKAEFRAFVESLDPVTEEGQRAFATAMTLAGGFAQLADGMEQLRGATQDMGRIAQERAGLETQLLQLQGNTTELRMRELAGLDGSNQSLQVRIWMLQDEATAMEKAKQTLSAAFDAVVQAGQAQIAELQKSFGGTDSAMTSYRSAVQKLESEFNSLFSSLDKSISELRGNVEDAFRMQYDQARAVIGTALVTRQLPQTADLSEALRVAQQGVMGQQYGSKFEQDKAYLTLANEMEALKGIAAPELDTAKATLAQLEDQYSLLRGTNRLTGDSLKALEDQLRAAISTEQSARMQISGIEAQIELAKQQHNTLLEIRDGVLSFPDALTAFASAMAAMTKVSAPVSGGGGGYTPVPGSDIGSSSWTTDYLYKNQDVLAAYDASWGLSPEAWAAYHYDTYGRNEGRSFAIGTNYVPYDMPANIHEGERIIPKADNVEIMRRLSSPQESGRVLVAAIDRLTAQNIRLEGRLASIEKSTGQLASQFDNVTAGGNAMATEEMAA